MGLGPLIQDPPDAGTVTTSASDRQVPFASGGKLAFKNPFFITPEDFVPGVGAGLVKATTAIQQAATAAIAAQCKLVLSPVNFYDVDDTVTLQAAAGGTSFGLDVEATGPSSNCIRWSGADNKSIFKSYGWKRSKISGVRVRFTTAATGVVVWDVDVDATRTSSGTLNWDSCWITTGANLTSCVGWRLGHDGAVPGTQSANSEESFMQFRGCSVAFNGTSANTGCIGWVNEHGNGLSHSWVGCAVSAAAKAWTNVATSGAGTSSGFGGDCMELTDCGGSYNDTELEFSRAGNYKVVGGRWEGGRVHISVPAGGGTTTAYSIVEVGVKGAAYSDNTAAVFNLAAAVDFTQTGCSFVPASGDFTAALFTVQTGAAGYGALNLTGNDYRAVDPFVTVSGGTWRKNFHGNGYVNVNGQRTALLTSQIDKVKLATYSRTRGQAGFIAPDARGLAFSAGSGVPTVNRVYLVRFFPTEDTTITKLAFVVGVTSGTTGDTTELGLYDATGARIAQTGAQSNLLTAAANTVQAVSLQVPTFTADTTLNSATLATVSSFTGVTVGTALSGTGIPAGTVVQSVNTGASTLVMSKPATATNVGVTVTTATVVQAGQAYYAGFQAYGTLGAAQVEAASVPVNALNKMFAATIGSIEMFSNDPGASGMPGTVTVTNGQTVCPVIAVRSS